MKKLILVCGALLYVGSAWGMAKQPYKPNDIIALEADDIAQWFDSIDESTLPKEGSFYLEGLIFEIGANKDSEWIKNFIKINSLKKLLLLQDKNKNTVLHHLADLGSLDTLLETLKTLDFALPTLRPLKNTSGKTAYDIYMEKDNDYRTAEIEKLLNPLPSPKGSAPDQKKAFNIYDLMGVYNADVAQKFIDSLDESTIVSTDDLVQKTHISLANLTDTNALKILLNSPKLTKLITASYGANGGTILHAFAERPNVTPEELDILLKLGIDKEAKRQTSSLFGKGESKTALDLYKERYSGFGIFTKPQPANYEAIVKLLTPGQSIRSEPNKRAFSLGNLLSIQDETEAKEFINTLDENTVPTTGDLIGSAHSALAGIKNTPTVKILLNSPKLKKLIQAKNSSNGTILHAFAERPNVTAGEIQILVDYGIDKNAQRRGLFNSVTAADIYKTRAYQDPTILKLLQPSGPASQPKGSPAQKLFSLDELKKITLTSDAEKYLKNIDTNSLPKDKSPELGALFEHIAESRSADLLKALLGTIPNILKMTDDNRDSLLHHTARKAANTKAFEETELRSLANEIVSRESALQKQLNSAGKTAAEVYLDGSETISGAWYKIFSGSDKEPFMISAFQNQDAAKLAEIVKNIDAKTVPTNPQKIKDAANTFINDDNFEKILVLPGIFENFAKPNKKILFETALENEDDAALEVLAALGLVPEAIDLTKYPGIDAGLKKLLETAAQSQGAAFYLKTLLEKNSDDLTEYLDRVVPSTLPQSGTAELRTVIEKIATNYNKNAAWFEKLISHPKMTYLFTASDEKGNTIEAILTNKNRMTFNNVFINHPSYKQSQPAPDKPEPSKESKKPYDLEGIIKGTLQLDDIDPQTIPTFISGQDQGNIIFNFSPEMMLTFATHPTTKPLIALKNPLNGRLLIHYAANSARDIWDNSSQASDIGKIRALIEAGSDLTAEDNEGKTPLALYTEKRFSRSGGSNAEIIALLTPRPLDARIATLAEALYTLSDEIGGTLGLFD